MKVKLIESYVPFNKVQKQFESKVIPALHDMGFTFDKNINEVNAFRVYYYGTYNSREEQKIPFKLEVSTTHKAIDETTDNIFLVLTIGNKTVELGACNTNDPNYIQDLIDQEFESSENISKLYSKNNSLPSEKIPSSDGKEAHTREEWRALFIKNRDTMSAQQFGSWYNKVYPLF